MTLVRMATVEKVMQAGPDEVFRVLANGWLYSHWVPGARRIHQVDRTFPRPGAGFQPEVGPSAFSTREWTTCIAVEKPHRIVLHAPVWPHGVAHISILLRPLPGGRTRVTLEEVPLKGPVMAFALPGMKQWLRMRNVEALRRLALLVERADSHARAGLAPPATKRPLFPRPATA